MRSCFIFLVVVSLLSLFATTAYAKETVAQPPGYYGPTDPGNFYGQEIQKVVDYLRSIGLNDYANNTELFLKAGKIIVKPLSGGDLAENGEKGGPVYVDDGAFNKPPKGFDPKKPADVAEMMSLADNLLHEKYHSENHNRFYRWCNQHYTKIGPNNVEVEAWSYSLTFLDDVIKQTLERANNTKINKQEKEDLLKLASYLLNKKINRNGDYEDNRYGPRLYAPPLLKGLKDNVEKERKKLEGNTSETVEVGSLIDSHNKLEEDVMKKYAAYKENYANTAESDTQACALNIIKIAFVVKNRSLEELIHEAAGNVPPDQSLLASPQISRLPPSGGYREMIGPNGEMILYQPTLEELMRETAGDASPVQPPVAPPQIPRLPPSGGYREMIGPNGEMILYQPTLEEAMKLYLVLDIDVPSNIGTGTQEFFLNYRPQQKIKISSEAKPEYADYVLTIPQSVFTQIYTDKDPAGKTRELFNQGKFSVVELEPERAVIEKELDEMLIAYKNVEKIPSSVRSLVVNERVNFMINIGEDKDVVRGVVLSDGSLESVKGGLNDATIEIRTTKRVFKNIRDAPDTQAAVLQALNDGSIEYKALKTVPSIKLFGARIVSKFAGLINRGDFRVTSGEKKPILYAGQDAVLEGNVHGLSVVTVPGNRDLPIVSSSGYALGYTTPRAQALIVKQPMIYSRNAGVYQYGITTYENHWLNIDYEPLVPSFATVYSPRELMTSAYNGRVYAKVGGFT